MKILIYNASRIPDILPFECRKFVHPSLTSHMQEIRQSSSYYLTFVQNFSLSKEVLHLCEALLHEGSKTPIGKYLSMG